MNTEEFMYAIGLSDRYVAAVQNITVSEEEVQSLPWSPLLSGPYNGSAPDKVLALFVRFLAAYGEPVYAERGVTHKEWLDTMRDITIWSDFLYAERGEIGLRETGWLSHLIKADIFRLGRLQFVPRLSENEITVGGKTFPAGTPYCEVHIPAGGKLLPASVDLSFIRAKELLAPCFYSCDSWLLSPKLKGVLNGGNILSFASRFTLLETDENSRGAERYIFGQIGDPQEYVAENRFAAWVKDMACKGSYVGSALGHMLS